MLIFSGKVSDYSGKKLQGVKVIVKQDGKPFKQGVTSPSGKYSDIEAPFGHTYTLIFEKSGMVSKTLVLDTKKGYFEDDTPPTTYIEPSISLFKEQKDVDYSIIEDQPVGKARIDPTNGKLDWDFSYSGQRKKEIERYLKQIEDQARQKEAQFKKMVAEGNNAYNKKDYELAILKYEEALKIKDDDVVVDKIEDARKNLLLAESQKELQVEYDALIKKGDTELGANNFDAATDFYTQAKSLLPGNQLAYDKLREVEKKKQELEDAALNKQFNDKMAEAQKSYEAKDWDNAKELYAAASTIKPNERSPRDRINEIDNLLSNMKANEENYNKLITKSDKQFTEKKFDDAISNYKEALKLKPDEAYPKEQITKAEAEKKAQEAQAELDRKYDNIIKKADNLLKNLSYEDAKTAYTEASSLKATESYPKDQIVLIDQKLSDLEAEKQRLAQLKKDYDAEIIKADQLYKDEKLTEALESYKKAKEIKTDESYPINMIDEINLKIQRSAAVEKDKRSRYDESIKSADAAFNVQNWKLAKQFYNDAIEVFSEEKYPADQIILIDQKILEEENLKAQAQQKNQQFDDLLNEGDLFIESKKYDESKAKYLAAKELFPDRVIVDQKLTHLQTLIDNENAKIKKDSTYNALIVQADQLKADEKWKDAKNIYHDALIVKPLESYPQEQIKLIENRIESDQVSSKRVKYDELIASADQSFTSKSYKEAMGFYNQANKQLPNEVYPLDRIREIKRILSDQEALENQYNILINQADNEYESENWDQALVHYKQAKDIFDKEYPNQRIEEINNILNDLKLAGESDQKKRADYDELIREADRLLAEQKYQDARDKFSGALALYDQEYYPKKKIAEIDVILQELNAEKETLDKYNELITNADALRDKKSWEEAKKLYLQANTVIPTNPYPEEQINFINDQMKTETNAEFQVQYDKLIAAADGKFNEKDYTKAKELFTRARNMNPNDNYPLQKLSEIDQLLIQMASNKIDDEKFQANQEKYNQLIKKADAAQSQEEWNKAKELYIQANKTLPSESYPQEQIDIINQKMKDSAVDEIEKQYNKIIDVADQMFKDEKYDKAINLYRRAQSIKPDDTYPPEQIKKVEEAKMIALNNDKTNKEFELLVKEGKRAFSAKNYRLSLKKFQQSLKIQSDAKFPTQKIAEINKILDQQRSDFKNNNNKTKQVDKNDFTTLYGDEVTGKYNEDQIDAIINQRRIDDVDNRSGSAEINKNIQGNFMDLNTKRQEELTMFHNQQLGIIAENIDKNFDNSDDSRWKVIPQIDQYKDQKSYLRDEANNFSVDKTLRNTENFSRLTSNITNLTLENEEKTSLNNTKSNQFFDEKMILDNDLIERGYSSTYNTSIQKEIIYNEVELENLQRKQNRNLLLVDISNFKENNAIINESDLGHNKNTTYTNYESNEAMMSKISENFNFSDNPRTDKIIPSFDYYKDDLLSSNNVKSLKGVNNSYDQFKGTESLTAKLNDFVLDADVSREQNVLDVDRFLEKEASKVSVWSDVNDDKGYNVHLVNERVSDDKELFDIDQESNRTMNISEQEVYSDRYLSDKNEIAGLNEKSNYMNAQQLEESKAVQATVNADLNTQQLALDYPEGITEKLFERKNTSGQVIEITILRIVIRGNKGDEYRKVKSKWGESFFKNGGVTSEYIWDTETN
jgi:tetratricopeptide (TPR) repeat protein